jgi:UDP-N-acetylmuramoyl-tripeptide--D-alanyl-D-alanine ligase
MRPLTLREVAEALHVALPVLLTGEEQVRGVTTDSRTVEPGDLFFALRGERTDGHHYLQEVFDKGAVAAVVEYVPLGAEGYPLLRVPSTVQALGTLAHAYRMRMPDLIVVGITGSTGKTTTRAMVAAALEAGFPNAVHSSPGNFNTEIGVPLTIFGLEPSHRMLVQEMAMRGRGQIAYLAEIARPQIGVITQIGWSHIELLGSRQAIAETKGELIKSLLPDGLAILPSDDRFYEFLRELARCPVRTFGRNPDADACLLETRLTPDHTAGRIRLKKGTDAYEEVELELPYLGEHLLINAAAALLVAAALGCDLQAAARALEKVQLPDMRMAIQRQPSGWTLINDAYNANPDSMHAALKVLLYQAPAQRRIAVLGDMKELGSYSMRLHWQLGRWIANQRTAHGAFLLDYLILVGNDVLWTAAAAKEGGFPPQRVLHFEDPLRAGEWLWRHVQRGDWVLLKGSRAMGLERIMGVKV